MQPTIMQLNFPTRPDESIPIGTTVVLWYTFWCIKIGPNIYEVYDIEKIEEEEKRRRLRPELITQSIEQHKPCDIDWYPEPKYRKTKKGSKKRNFWESPSWF